MAIHTGNTTPRSAGSRDSSLTNHGVLQTKRLGAHIASCSATIGCIRHLFASNLQRAYQTAEAIADACRPQVGNSTVTLDVIRVEELREKDLGLSEGTKFSAKESDDGSESPESIHLRINRFLDHHLGPVIDHLLTENATVIVVSHGIVLNVLLKALLPRYPPKPASSSQIAEGHGLQAAHQNLDHLQSLKKTCGSIGSAKFD
ncbi:phosphoglycerate mutase-like protein [Xylariaceae sp. AK1471]|nr:phosphoglycerate mutase-like protein [Xylariaceae sp. AK1471]